jgi:hypothetical protein
MHASALGIYLDGDSSNIWHFVQIKRNSHFPARKSVLFSPRVMPRPSFDVSTINPYDDDHVNHPVLLEFVDRNLKPHTWRGDHMMQGAARQKQPNMPPWSLLVRGWRHFSRVLQSNLQHMGSMKSSPRMRYQFCLSVLSKHSMRYDRKKL